jgi:RNA polymerase sigma factor (sigma-70 family)
MVENAIGANSVEHDDDRSVASSIGAGDHLAFERLMRRHNRRLYRIARATLRDRTEAEDVLQDAYLQAYRSIKQFRGEASLSTWLSRLVLNECFGRMRRQARRDNVASIASPDAPIEYPSMLANESESPDRELERMQVRDLLERKVDELPETFRIVFVLRAVEELSVDETAASLGIPQETVRSRHFRAKTMLRAALVQDLELAESELFEFGGTHCDKVVASVLARLANSS